MALFSIRVELHDATWANYIALAENLRRVGIVDTVVSDARGKYKLPPAEYNYEGNATIDQVHQSANAAAALTGRRFAVFTSEAVRRKWTGLDTAQ